MQPVEHPLQSHKRATAVRALVDVTLQTRPLPRPKVAVQEVREVVGGPPVISAKAVEG
jgi:hypothetical protein